MENANKSKIHPHIVTTLRLRDYNGGMEMIRQMTVRAVRKHADQLAGDWTAVEMDEGGSYTLRCGDVELCTINTRKPRVFRSLEAVKQALKEEMGITEFKVAAVKM